MTVREQYSQNKLDRRERGSTLVLVTLFMLVLFGFTALSIDVANVYREKHKAQVATDAAALAGVAQVGDPSVAANIQKNAAITEADVIANTNGVKDTEITAAPAATNGCVGCAGLIQVGSWDGTTFTANATPYNAVRVPAQRTVTNNFGRVVGFPVMKPAVDSIATVGAITIPFGVGTNALPNTFPTSMTLSNVSPGNWGPLDVCGTLNGSKTTADAIGGNGCFAAIDTATSQANGFDGVCDGFKSLIGRTVVMPVVDSFANGNGDTTIVNFIVVTVLSVPTCNGANFTANVLVLGEGFNALRQNNLAPVRALVQ